MNPKIRFLSTRYGKKYVCSDGVFSGIGDSFPEAYEDWETQGRGAYDFANAVMAQTAEKSPNHGDILGTVERVVWEIQNGLR